MGSFWSWRGETDHAGLPFDIGSTVSDRDG